MNPTLPSQQTFLIVKGKLTIAEISFKCSLCSSEYCYRPSDQQGLTFYEGQFMCSGCKRPLNYADDDISVNEPAAQPKPATSLAVKKETPTPDLTKPAPGSTINYPGNKHADGVWQRIINELPPHDGFISGYLGSCKVSLEKQPAPKFNFGIESNLTEELREFWYRADKKHITIRHAKFLDFMRETFTLSKQMTDRILIYLDPPYMLSTRRSQKELYEHEMSDEDHYELLQWCDTTTQTSNAMIAISHYPCKAYDELLNNGWRKIEYKSANHRGVVTEALYMNYPEPQELHEYTYLGKDRIDRQRIKRKIAGKVKQLQELPALERSAILRAMMNLTTPPIEKENDKP